MTGENVSATVALDVSVSPKSVLNSPSGVLILEENNDHMPSEEEILMYATSIGIDVEKEPELIYLAREGISAPLPEGWSAIQDKDNNIFYHECSTGRTTQDHPMDALYRKLVTDARKRKTTNATNTTAGTTAVTDQKLPSTPKPSCSSAGGQKALEGAQSVTPEKKPPVASLGPVSDDLPTTYQALPFPHMRRSVQTSAAPPSLFRTPVDRVPDRRAGPLHHSPFLAPASPRVSLDKTALVTAERRLSALQAHVHCLKASTDVNTVRNADYLTPADRWFWSAARPKSPRPYTHTAQPAAKVHADEMPRLETSPSSQLRQKPPRVLGEVNNYVDHPTGGRAGGGGLGVGRFREEQVASDSDRENVRSRRGRIQAEESGDGDALNLQFSRALRLSDRTPAVDAISSGHFERHKESGVAGLYSLYSPPGSSGGKAASAASCGSCAATHSQYQPHSGDIRTEPAALPTCFLPSPTTTTSPTAFDANLGLRCMMDERARLQRKMTCLKLTYKAYKMKLAEMDSGLRMLYSAASSASSPYVTLADAAFPSGPSPRPSVRDRSLSVHRRPPNEDRSNMTSSESSVGDGGGGGTVSPSDHRHSLSRYPASAIHQSDLYLNTLAGRPLIKHRLYRQSELTRLQTPEALPRFRRSSSHSASRGL